MTKYYAIKVTFGFYRDYVCEECTWLPQYNKYEQFEIINTVYEPIDNIKEFMEQHGEHINLNLTFLKSYPKYKELKIKAIGKWIDQEMKCENENCAHGEPIFAGYDNAIITKYESKCLCMELVRDQKRELMEDINK